MEYKITAVQPRNEWNAGFGDMKDYAISLEGQSGWVKLTQKLQTPPPQVGETIYGIIEEKTNKNGTAYTKFKKLQRDQTAPQGNSRQSTATDEKLDYIIEMLEELVLKHDSPKSESPAVSNGSTSDEVEENQDPFADLGI